MSFIRPPLATPASAQRPLSRSAHLLGLLLAVIACISWLPTALILAHPLGDQVSEKYIDLTAVCVNKIRLGYYWDHIGQGTTLKFFVPFASASALRFVTCKVAQFLSVDPLLAYLAVGQLLTWVMCYLAMRWVNFSASLAHVAGFLMVTAPCSFSRVGHLGLSFMLPIIPTMVAALKLHQLLSPRVFSAGVRVRIGTGAVSALLTLPYHEYYIVFSLTILLACWLFEMLAATNLPSRYGAQLYANLKTGALFASGYVSVLLCFALPKVQAGFSSSLPIGWGASRYAIEQFRYGLLPFTWFIPSPAIGVVTQQLYAAGISPSTESYFWSAGSLLIPLGWILAARRLLKPWQRDSVCRFLALLLLLITAIGLLVMTMGGLGTLFAAFISPVLRSLNRFTAFVYGSAVIYLLSEFDAWIMAREKTA